MAKAPLYNGDTLIGEVVENEDIVFTPEEPVLIIRLNKQAGLVKELMKEELIYFDIVNIPAVRS
jgi:hypothetical protein